MRRWTEEEVRFLKESYGKIPIEDIEKKLGRTRRSIRYKARRLGLRVKVYSNILRVFKGESKLNLSQFNLGFLVGIIEGEGYICLNGKSDVSLHPKISIGNTDLRLIKKLIDILKTKRKIMVVKPSKPKRKTLYVLVIEKMQDAYRILKTIEPYLISKKELCSLAIEFIEEKLKTPRGVLSERQKEIIERMKKLNRERKSLTV